ncbi:hypothetical protein D9758_011271 [Tetrapyrgos nigripes]|uniref:Uncharacterized protein n=1 Tax=Tetrapyrgos nigripes TaxID=182062 RepID=A0A8H5CT47_9AGAR|nr:hypothetical protein D9758_011271 [Tetrapyrgos nigripes]
MPSTPGLGSSMKVSDMSRGWEGRAEWTREVKDAEHQDLEDHGGPRLGHLSPSSSLLMFLSRVERLSIRQSVNPFYETGSCTCPSLANTESFLSIREVVVHLGVICRLGSATVTISRNIREEDSTSFYQKYDGIRHQALITLHSLALSRVSSFNFHMLDFLQLQEFYRKYTAEAHLTFQTTVYVAGVLFALLALESFIRFRRHLQGIKRPLGASWLWGHEREVWEQSAGVAYANWMSLLQTDVFKIKGALRKPDILVVADPLAVTYIMQKRIYDYRKSLGWVEGESEHKRMRHLVAPALSNDAIKKGVHKVFSAAETLEDNLQKHMNAHGGASVISACDWVNQATIDVIGKFGFDHNFEGGRSEDAQKILNSWRNMAIMGISERGFLALMLLRRFPILNYLPLKALKAQGDVRMNIHSGVAKVSVFRLLEFQNKQVSFRK